MAANLPSIHGHPWQVNELCACANASSGEGGAGGYKQKRENLSAGEGS